MRLASIYQASLCDYVKLIVFPSSFRGCSIFTSIENGSFRFGITGATPIITHTANIQAKNKSIKNLIIFLKNFILYINWFYGCR